MGNFSEQVWGDPRERGQRLHRLDADLARVERTLHAERDVLDGIEPTPTALDRTQEMLDRLQRTPTIEGPDLGIGL